VLTVLDEACAEYLDLPDYPGGLDFLREGRRVVVLRTFSKAYGLAGLRLGYALGPQAIIDALEQARSPFNTSRVAQAAGLAALGDAEHLLRSRESNQSELRFLQEQLRLRGLRFTPSVANFLLVHFPGSGEAIYRALLQQGVIVRPMRTASRMPSVSRWGPVRKTPDCLRLSRPWDLRSAGRRPNSMKTQVFS
jgi:histidinol-phosphate aminotransferase